jgi:quinoprotein glucose dehydrogenase
LSAVGIGNSSTYKCCVPRTTERIGAAADQCFRAFDLRTGREVWKAPLPAGGQATPMSYESKGRQFVVITAGGHSNVGTRIGDYTIAFALPTTP